MTHCHTGLDVGLENVTQLLYGVQVLQHREVLHERQWYVCKMYVLLCTIHTSIFKLTYIGQP